ncbi:NACHT, LRR and PYD domains-containing protein 12-like [Numenius arquata]|uniref:NACHT, LRR and PYD domains-containing protein 12-like n=1 Tax=Numenius arquata TaxID=31919 RepID=UPI003D30C032
MWNLTESAFSPIVQNVNGDVKQHLSRIDPEEDEPALALDFSIGLKELGLLKTSLISEDQGFVFVKSLYPSIAAVQSREEFQHVSLTPTEIIDLLLLWHCQLTSTVCGDLAAVLGASQSLRELDLGGNELGDLGLQLLCEGLKHPSCQLQTLRLWHCQLTSTVCGDLAAVLGASQSLRELDLGGNELGDLGLQLLCEGLKHPSCQLQTLRLWHCQLTSTVCGDLAAVLGASQSLRELDLGGNELGDLGLQLLCEGLKHPSCQLQTLRLRSCLLTSACCGYLAMALSTNLSMRDLDLSFNRLEDSGVQLLCEKLKRPDWQLQTLRGGRKQGGSDHNQMKKHNRS